MKYFMNMSVIFNQICLNKEMLPKYTQPYIYIYIKTERKREGGGREKEEKEEEEEEKEKEKAP